MGLVPHNLSDVLLDSMMDMVIRYRDRVKEETLMPLVNWRNTRNPSSYQTADAFAAESPGAEGLPIQGARGRS